MFSTIADAGGQSSAEDAHLTYPTITASGELTLVATNGAPLQFTIPEPNPLYELCYYGAIRR